MAFKMLLALVTLEAGLFVGCGAGDDFPPMLGDCTDCQHAARSAGGISEGGLRPPGGEGLDAGAAPDATEDLDIVDVGVFQTDASDALAMVPDVINFL